MPMLLYLKAYDKPRNMLLSSTKVRNPNRTPLSPWRIPPALYKILAPIRSPNIPYSGAVRKAARNANPKTNPY